MFRTAAIAALLVPLLLHAQTPMNCNFIEEAVLNYIKSDNYADNLRRSGLNVDNTRVVFVVFDHRSKDWRVIRMNRGRNARRKPDDKQIPRFDMSDLSNVPITSYSDGVPDITAAGGDKVVFALANTNLGLYSLTKVIAPEDVPELAKLKQIVAGFAGVARDVVTRAGRSAATLAAVPAGEPVRGNEEVPADKVKRIREAAVALSQVIDAAERYKREIVSTLQYAELGLSTTPLRLSEYSALVADVRTKIDELQSALDSFHADPFVALHSCPRLAEIMKTVQFDGLNASAADQHARQLIAALRAAACEVKSIDAAVEVIGKKEQDFVDVYLDNIEFVQEIEKTATEALGAVPDLLANAAAIAQFSSNYRRLNPLNDPCALTSGFLVAERPDDVVLDKIGVVTVTVNAVSPLGGTYARREDAEEDRKYRIAHRMSSRLAYGVGIVYTSVKNPSFSTVQNPLNEEETVIAKTGEKSRTGDLALLASYRFGSEGTPLRPGLQFGIGLESKTPLYLGASFDLGRYLRLGGGVTAHRVTALARGYRALSRKPDGSVDPGSLSRIGTDDAVPTRDRFTTRGYVALIITLDAIPFFEKNEGE